MFNGVIQSAPGGGHYVVLPVDVAVELGAKHLARVKDTIAGASYRSGLIKAHGLFYLGLHKATLKSAGKDAGDEVALTIEFDDEPRSRPS